MNQNSLLRVEHGDADRAVTQVLRAHLATRGNRHHVVVLVDDVHERVTRIAHAHDPR